MLLRNSFLVWNCFESNVRSVNLCIRKPSLDLVENINKEIA